ncbi:MAG: D-amino acid aminotransferase [Alcaligenaceae bacterium]|nr:D-amino acid aminotransferase [Alcaligenaceae bacterium]
MIEELIPGIAVDVDVYLNGDILPLSEAKISVLDRGFIFGDGIYEVVPVYHRKPFRLEQHVARLMRSLDKISLQTDKTVEDWKHLMTLMAERAPWDDSLVYLQVTRGVAKRDHQFPNPPVKPTIFVMVAPRVAPSAEEIAKGLRTVSMQDMRWLHCDIKSVSLLGNVLSKQYAVDRGVDDVIQFRDGYLSEASSANIWVVKNGTVIAPPKDNLVLEGVRYGLIEELCRTEGIPFELRAISKEEVAQADEIFLSSATKEILPIVELDAQAIANGEVGPIYNRLKQAYNKVLAAL